MPISAAWIPNNWDEICKRNAGRKKMHMRKRKERARRIISLLIAMEKGPVLRETAHGWLNVAAEAVHLSKATASRDFALGRRIHRQSVRMFGRPLQIFEDEVIWSWDWAHYGFRTNWHPRYSNISSRALPERIGPWRNSLRLKTF